MAQSERNENEVSPSVKSEFLDILLGATVTAVVFGAGVEALQILTEFYIPLELYGYLIVMSICLYAAADSEKITELVRKIKE